MSTTTTTFDRARLLNVNCPVSSGGETVITARNGETAIAEITVTRDSRTVSYTEYRVVDYEVDWLDGRDDDGRTFYVSDYPNARAALTAARAYIRKGIS